MSFIEFCRSLGIVVRREPPLGRWVRLPTEDKPRHRNGAIKYMGDYGFAQNWATMESPATWQNKGAQVDLAAVRRAAADDARKRARAAQIAADRAQFILSESAIGLHPYCEAKGFPDERVHVWREMAVIPMRTRGHLVGAQLVAADGTKRFLTGQRSWGATFDLGRKGLPVLCEGYATALSVRDAIRSADACVVACFSAGNMAEVAKRYETGLVIADNDASGTGERIAQQIGWPYWMSDTVGEDANDFARRAGGFALAMELRQKLILTSVRMRANRNLTDVSTGGRKTG